MGTKTGWTVEDCVEDVEDLGDDPERQYYYVQYSDVYHTTPCCPYIQNSDNLNVAGILSNLNGPYSGGANRVISKVDDGEDIDLCSWCSQNDT